MIRTGWWRTTGNVRSVAGTTRGTSNLAARAFVRHIGKGREVAPCLTPIHRDAGWQDAAVCRMLRRLDCHVAELQASVSTGSTTSGPGYLDRLLTTSGQEWRFRPDSSETVATAGWPSSRR